MKSEYTVLPAFYDALNSDVDYEAYLFYISRNLDLNTACVLDLGCGTGDMSILMAKKGASVIGLDNSPEMLALASHKAEKAHADVFYTCQDMTSFSTGRTYDAVISTFDSLNYVTSKAGLARAFTSVSRELKDGGIFLFDMNSEYKFKEIYSDNSYVLEADGIFCAWQNFYDVKSKLCDFYINIFAEENGVYKRFYEEQTERMFTLDEIKACLKKAGLRITGVFSDFEKSEVNEKTERYYIIAEKI